jgi:hypothetical protein
VINVAELLVDPDFVRSFTIKRPTGSFANEGVYSVTYSDLSATGCVQPASPRELQLMPEGSRLGDVIAVWSNVEMRVADGKVESDVIVVDSKNYKVVKCEPWPESGYYKALAEGYVK